MIIFLVKAKISNVKYSSTTKTKTKTKKKKQKKKLIDLIFKET